MTSTTEQPAQEPTPLEVFNSCMVEQVNKTILDGLWSACRPTPVSNNDAEGSKGEDGITPRDPLKTWRVFQHNRTGVRMALRNTLEARDFKLISEEPQTLEACLRQINASTASE